MTAIDPYAAMKELLGSLFQRRLEMRCARDVRLMLLTFESPDPWYAFLPAGVDMGSAALDLFVDPEYESGVWKVFENGELVKEGRLGD